MTLEQLQYVMEIAKIIPNINVAKAANALTLITGEEVVKLAASANEVAKCAPQYDYKTNTIYSAPEDILFKILVPGKFDKQAVIRHYLQIWNPENSITNESDTKAEMWC